VDLQADPAAEGIGNGNARRSTNGTIVPDAVSKSAPITGGITIEPAHRPDDRVTIVAVADDNNPELVSPILRACLFAIIAFEIGYTALDRGEYPQTFAITLPLHIASVTFGLAALIATLSARAMRHWRAITLILFSSLLASTASIAVVNRDSNVLVASLLLFFFGAGSLLPWNARYQAALEGIGAIGLLAYSSQTTDPNPRIGIAWMVLVSGALLSQLTVVLSLRYRRKLAEQLTALAQNDRLLRHEMELRAEAAVARERDHVRLQASEAMLRKVFEASPDNIAVNSLVDGRFIAVNDEYQVAGYTRDDVMKANVIDLGMWRHEEQLNRFLETLRQTGRVKNMEIAQRRKDGTEDETHLISASTIDVSGEPCVISMIRDITEIKRVSHKLEQSVKALRDSEETFRKLFDANLDSMTLTGADGNYLDVNQEFVNATGFSREESIGHHFSELVKWVNQDEMLAFSKQLFGSNIVRNLEVAFRMKDGSEQPVLLSAINLELHGEMCCLTICRNIADVKMTQRELVAAREAALAASRAKSEFLSSMSHEIRTPMNSILGMSDQLMETALDDEQRRCLSTVISNGHTLLALINSILDLAKVESGRISLEAVEFNLKDVTEKVLETLAIRAHEKSLELMVRFAFEVPEVVLGDPLRLGQVLINLIGNAIKFTHNGQVLVSVSRDADSIIAGMLKFTVTDTGIGVPADQRHLLFKAFSQADSSTSRKYGGSGLGLAIVSRLVALMHGEVAVASEPGAGSAFSFTAQFGVAKSIPAARARSFDGVRILVVDHNTDSRSIVSELLEGQGAQVIQASSPTDAMTALRESRVQVVLLDIASPLQRGFNLAEQLFTAGHCRPQIVMMLRTSDLTSEVSRLRALGIDSYIVKPVRRAELFAAVARACAGAHNLREDRPAPLSIASHSASSAILNRPLQILMADDSNDNRALIRAYLKKTPYLLVEAEDGQDAIDKFIAGNFDVVLMDIQMPNVDGYEATSAIRVWELANSRRRTPIVALTASALELEEAKNRSKAAGCDAHITKPVKRSTLLEGIRDAIEGNMLDDEPTEVTRLKEETCRTE
jgi:PAS domain S-box-containing protein